jgi:hypothetical protein
MFSNFSISTTLLGTVILPNLTGAIQLMPPLSFIDSRNGHMVLSYTLGRNESNTASTEKGTVFTLNEKGQIINSRSVVYDFDYYVRYPMYLQCFDVSGNPEISAYCCIDRASQMNGSFIHCNGPNANGKSESNYKPLHGRMILTDWIEHNDRLVLVYLIISDQVTLVLHPDRHIVVPFSDKIPKINPISNTLNNQVFISTATKLKQSDLTFTILLLVHTDWSPCYYICSYQLNLEKDEVIALECTALPALYQLIRNLTNTEDNRVLPEAYAEIVSTPFSEKLYLIHVPAEFPEYAGSEPYGYKDIAAFSSSGAFVGIDSLPYQFPVVAKYMNVINNAFAGNLNYCLSSMRYGPEIPEVDKPDDPDDKYMMRSALNVYRYSAKICIQGKGRCYELAF